MTKDKSMPESEPKDRGSEEPSYDWRWLLAEMKREDDEDPYGF
jgi:hypothetical protein